MVSMALWTLNEDYLSSSNSRMFQSRHRIVAANVALKVFQRDTNLAAQDLHLVCMSRNGSMDRPAQNVYNSLYHHVKDLRASTRGIVGLVQHQYLRLVIRSIDQKHLIGSRRPAVVSILRDLGHLNDMMARIF